MEPTINVNEKEIDLIKRTFQDNEQLLKSIRALFFGLGVTEEEKALIKETFSSDELKTIMWKRFYPQLDNKTPIGQVQDIWLGAEQMVFGQNPNVIDQAVKYKDLSLKYTKQSLELLENPDGQSVNINYDPNRILNDPLQIQLLARNQFIRHIEQQLLFLWVIASQKESTPKEIKEKMTKNSTQ